MAMSNRIKRIITMVAVLLMILILSGCDWDLLPASMEIVGTPERIVYIANVDTELDLSGLNFVFVSMDGLASERPLMEMQRMRTFVSHDIDFTTPGVYEVTFEYHWVYEGGLFDRDMVLSFSFYVQVIDKETFLK